MIKATDLIVIPLVLLTAIGVIYFFSEYSKKNSEEIFWILKTQEEQESEENFIEANLP